MPELIEYDVECLPQGADLPAGRIYFADMPEPMLRLLTYALCFRREDADMRHKLGALKPYGYGSIEIAIDGRKCLRRDMANPFADLASWTPASARTIFDSRAWRYLKRIMHYPTTAEQRDYIFVYPHYRQEERGGPRLNAEQKGFAQAAEPRDTANPLTPANCRKIPMFFDHYQQNAINFQAVMGGRDYTHLNEPPRSNKP